MILGNNQYVKMKEKGRKNPLSSAKIQKIINLINSKSEKFPTIFTTPEMTPNSHTQQKLKVLKDYRILTH